jgi:hypothetical protein
MQQASQPERRAFGDLGHKLRRMTILVGMIGSDGIVLAADQRQSRVARDENEFDDYADIRKITILDKHKVASARVGDQVSMIVSDRISAELDSGSFDFLAMRLHLMEIAELVVKAEEAKPGFDPYQDRTLLIVFYGNQRPEFPQLWRLRISPPSPAAEPITGITISGAIGNRARFFDHYFKDNASIQTLKFLAAHIVLMAHKFDQSLIRGLDVGLFDSNGLRLISEAEKDELRQNSQALDRSIERQIFPA